LAFHLQSSLVMERRGKKKTYGDESGEKKKVHVFTSDIYFGKLNNVERKKRKKGRGKG